MLQLNHYETTALLILFQNDPTLTNLFNRLRTSSFTGTDGKLNHSSKWRKSSLSWTRSSQQIKLCSTLQRIFLRARSLISASWWPVKVQHRAIAQLQRDAHPEFTLPLSYLRRGPGQGEEGNQIFFTGGPGAFGMRIAEFTQSPRWVPGGCPSEARTRVSRLRVDRPRKRYTAILSKWPRQEGDWREGQLSLLPSFLMSPVKTISSRSISLRRRIKLPRHSVRLQLVSPWKPSRSGLWVPQCRWDPPDEQEATPEQPRAPATPQRLIVSL